MAGRRRIVVIDETIREGMQYRGVMFSVEQRLKILAYQERLGVDVCQAAYPPAHASEEEALARLQQSLSPAGRIRLAGMGRAWPADIDIIARTGVSDIHLHAVLTAGGDRSGLTAAEKDLLGGAVGHARESVANASIHISLLDIGRTGPEKLAAAAAFLINTAGVDILTLPDTSGMLTPDEISRRIQPIAGLAEGRPTRIGIHCHNDLGMAAANTVMGGIAGAGVVEVSALGIGERNGIGDLFLVAKCLKEKGFELGVKTGDEDTFREYYAYVDAICFDQTGEHLLDYRTPFFGDAVKTHVAGTHGQAGYGVRSDADYCMNVLCGRHLVAKFLQARGAVCKSDKLPGVVNRIKSQSVALGRALTPAEVLDIAGADPDHRDRAEK